MSKTLLSGILMSSGREALIVCKLVSYSSVVLEEEEKGFEASLSGSAQVVKVSSVKGSHRNSPKHGFGC